MEIRWNDSAFSDEICALAYQKYCEEILRHPIFTQKTKADFSAFFGLKQQMQTVIAVEGDRCAGFLLYSFNEKSDRLVCSIPVWGYGANSKCPEKIIGYLFECLADKLVSDKKVDFFVHLYACDEKLQRLFSYLQFGILSETTVRALQSSPVESAIKIRELPKAELHRRWPEVWALLSALIGHLRKSPVFYPGVEFTEALYQQFFSEEETTVFVAEDNGKFVGIIESNADNLKLVFADSAAANVGEIYVLPQYRGRQVAQALLSCAENDLLSKNIRYAWVEHGTANPNARGFWNKYFEPIFYQLIRTIEP